MRPIVRYEAGLGTEVGVPLRVDLVRANLDENRADLIARFVEFWCQRHCRGGWKLIETDREISVWLSNPRDRVLFLMSDEARDFVC